MKRIQRERENKSQYIKLDFNFMAELICTTKEFHRFIGPRIRNTIQAITKKRKKELDSICQICRETKELEAAHIVGNDRKSIIEKILKRYKIDDKKDLIKIDLDIIEKEIISAHRPIDRYFKFLCSKCHNKYDSKK